MNKDALPDDLVDDTIRMEVNLPVIRQADPIQFGRNMASHGQFGKARTRISAKAVLTGLLRLSRMHLELWASILSSASDSWVCS